MSWTTLAKPTLASIRSRAMEYDQTADWPAADLVDLAAAGTMRWAIPTDFGGDGLDPLELHLRYESIAAASLSTVLILTQRDSAIGFILGAETWPFRESWLHQLAENEFFTTIGIAQLTTSRQAGPPALRAARADGGWQLDGLIPWSTGPAVSRYVFAGAVCDKESSGNGNGQILFALPTSAAGVAIAAPMQLVALRSSWTTSIRCDGVFVPDDLVLRGPVPSALAGRVKSIAVGQAFLATGLCQGALDLIATHDSQRARETRERFAEQLASLRDELLAINSPAADPAAIAAAGPRLRGACNELAVRVTHAAVALFKGTALLSDHPAQRLAREAMFLLVWSCPDPVIDCTVNALSDIRL
jgi:alkylation response protein AidB-like acyl-CoA dehydrogenase